MKVLVTGAAGFIGSRLCGRLLDQKDQVIGIDCLTDFYPRWIKERNLAPLLARPNFEFQAADLLDLDLNPYLKRVEIVYHLAAQAGVRSSWGESFFSYLSNNIQTTQKLLEAAKNHAPRKLIYASSSSVYGLTPTLPMREDSPLYPLSPYGVTKLAAEQLCFLYHKNYGLPTVSLRFFTVYGPGQRPDMAFHRFFRAIREDHPITIYGDGRQTRDFTYIDDIVDACLAASEKARTGETYNLGGGHRETLADLLPLFEEVSGRRVNVAWEQAQKGDVPHTLADISKARNDLGFSPRMDLREGLRREWEWVDGLYRE